MKNNVLFIAPHADDEILGCGATIYKMVQEGHNVYVLIMTNASKSDPNIFSEKGIQRRQLSGFAFLMILINLTVLFHSRSGRRDTPQYPPAEDHPGWIPEVFEDPCHGSKNWLSAGNKKGTQVVSIIASGVGCLLNFHGAKEIICESGEFFL